jgi:hypothetical protein
MSATDRVMAPQYRTGVRFRVADCDRERPTKLRLVRVRRWLLLGMAFVGTSVAALRQRFLAQNERRLGMR